MTTLTTEQLEAELKARKAQSELEKARQFVGKYFHSDSRDSFFNHDGKRHHTWTHVVGMKNGKAHGISIAQCADDGRIWIMPQEDICIELYIIGTEVSRAKFEKAFKAIQKKVAKLKP
jgi:hypothetical protein